MAQARYYSSIAATTTLSVSIDDVTTTLTPATTSGFPASYPYLLILEKDTANEELVDVTGSTGTALTVVRGVDGTAARGHSAGTSVEHGVSARDFRESRQHEAASEQVHGIEAGSNVVGETDTQTLTNKTIDGATIINPNFEISAPDGETPALNVPGDLNMQNYKIINLGDPVNDQDGVNKRYVESRIPELTEGDVTLAKEWATKMDGLVNGEDYSSKWYADDSKKSANSSSQSASAAAQEALSAANDALIAQNAAAATLGIWNDFQKRYLGAFPSPPATDNAGNELETGALYFDTSSDNMYVWDGDQWIVASSAAINTFDQYEWTATDGQTVFTTNKDMNPSMLQVYVNGVMVAKSDYTADKRSVTLLEPTIAGDLVQVHAFQEATILSNVITSQEVDFVVVLPFDSWPLPDPDDRTLYVVLPEAGKDYGTLWLGSIQIGGAGGGGGLEGSPPPPIVSWDSDDPAVSDYRKLTWTSGGMGDAGPTIGYGVLPANDAAKGTTITHVDSQSMEARITGTEAGVEYAYKVFAANLAGPGESSEPVTRIFPGPDAPTNLRSDPNDAFTLMWDHDGQAAVVGDDPVDSYEVIDNIVSRAVVSIDVAGKTATLDPNDYSGGGQFYRFQVRACTPDGCGDWSEEYQREFVLPGTPYNLRVEGTTLMWDFDEVDTGPITQWDFEQAHWENSDPPEDSGMSPEPGTDAQFGPVETA